MQQPPDRRQRTTSSRREDTVVALNKLFLGDTDAAGNADATAWRTIGYNLDGLISTKNGTNHCKAQKAAHRRA